jgi:hypothetical protein
MTLSGPGGQIESERVSHDELSGKPSSVLRRGMCSDKTSIGTWFTFSHAVRSKGVVSPEDLTAYQSIKQPSRRFIRHLTGRVTLSLTLLDRSCDLGSTSHR